MVTGADVSSIGSELIEVGVFDVVSLRTPPSESLLESDGTGSVPDCEGISPWVVGDDVAVGSVAVG